MFTGIIEAIGQVFSVHSEGDNRVFWVSSDLSRGFRPDQSISHNGVCLTVEEVKENMHRVIAVHETLRKTNLGAWEKGNFINLEQCLTLHARLDGHLVQGHADTTATCMEKEEQNGSWKFRFSFPEKFAPLIIEKGSVSVNGISLTAFDVTTKKFSVAIIPYTYTHTNMQFLKKGEDVNIEFDLIGKYVLRRMEIGKDFEFSPQD